MNTNLPGKLEKALVNNPLLNPNMLGFFQNQKPKKIVSVNDSYMVAGNSDELWWYMLCNCKDDFTEFLDGLRRGAHFFAAISDWMMAEIEVQFDLDWNFPCIRFYLPDDVELPKHSLNITALTPADTEVIFNNSNYQSITSPEYISQQLKLRPGVAYRDGKILAGWAMFHDDGALGLLHVLNNYRRQGIARALVVELCQRHRAEGIIPYTSVEPTNKASLGMVRSLGFRELDNIHWCKAVR